MFTYIVVANVNPSIPCKVELSVCSGKGARTMCLFTSLKSVRSLTVWPALEIMDADKPHSDSVIFQGLLFLTVDPLLS